jgi:hypothetical protein
VAIITPHTDSTIAAIGQSIAMDAVGAIGAVLAGDAVCAIGAVDVGVHLIR